MSEVFGRIILERKGRLFNRMRSYRVLINGVEQGRIRNGSTEEYEVPGGSNSIICKTSWCSSNLFPVVIRPGETVYLKVDSGIKYFWAGYTVFLAFIIVRTIFKAKTTPFENMIITGITVAVMLYFLYYITIGRKQYLKIEEDTDNIFAR